MLYFVTFTYIFKVTNLNVNEMVRAIAKIRNVTFSEVDIRHRMASWSLLYSMILSFIFQGQMFYFCSFATKNAQAKGVPSRFASTRTASASELVLFVDDRVRMV